MESGLHKNNIEIHRHDTYSKPSLFYSYRRSVHKEDDYGRNISIIVKKNHKDENNILYK